MYLCHHARFSVPSSAGKLLSNRRNVARAVRVPGERSMTIFICQLSCLLANMRRSERLSGHAKHKDHSKQREATCATCGSVANDYLRQEVSFVLQLQARL